MNSQHRNGSMLWIQRNTAWFVWTGLFIMFMVVSLPHSNFTYAFFSSFESELPMVILFLILRFVAIPKLLKPHKKWIYYLIVSLLVFLFAPLAAAFETEMFKFFIVHNIALPPHLAVIKDKLMAETVMSMFSLMKFFFVLIITVAFTTSSFLLEESRNMANKIREQQYMLELRYLKSQINPHFLFNALNNIYSMAFLKDEKTPEMILKLSDLFRYVTDSVQSDHVPIKAEIEYINNYIEFQKLRMEHEPNITFDKFIADPSYQIPPMIFQPLVENCFKHSRLENDKDSFIHIYVKQAKDYVVFITENSQFKFSNEPKDHERIGVGISNIQQRLNLLYHDDYKLTVFDEDNKYKVELILNTKL